MIRNIVLLLGGNIMNYGIIKKYKERGMQVYVIDWNQYPALKGDKHYAIDVKNPEKILNALKADGVLDHVLFAYTSIDLAVPSVAKINSVVGLKTISEKGLLYSSSKSKMSNRWKEEELLNKMSLSFEDYTEKIEEINKSYKLIFKPDNSSSSRGITVVEKNSDFYILKNAFKKAKEEAANGIVVVEEFVEGTEYTVEMIGDSYGNVCVYGISRKAHTKNTEKNKIAVKLHYNGVGNTLQKKIAEFAIKCYKALYLSASLGHLEVIVKDDGSISPVEIGARSSGNIASDLVDIVSGIIFLDELLRVYNGGHVYNGLHKQTEMSSVYYFYDFPAGSYIKKEACILDYCDSSISSRFFDRRFLSVGNKFTTINSDNARYGYEILEGPKSLMTIDYIDKVEKNMMKDVLEYGKNF